MTDTPRTDNTDHWRVDRDEADLTYVDVVSADFARELERELSEFRAAPAELVTVEDLSVEIIDSVANDGDVYGKYFRAKRDDMDRRKPLAWSTARALATKEK